MLRIGQLAAQTGVSVRSLRYYEEQGLLACERSESGQRRYPESAADMVLFVQQMYAAGLTSADVRALLPCVLAGHTDASQREMLAARRSVICARRDELQAALDRLDSVIASTATHP